MITGIKRDHARFKEIVKGRIKGHLKKYITQGELIGRQGKDYVSIPSPRLICRALNSASARWVALARGMASPEHP